MPLYRLITSPLEIAGAMDEVKHISVTIVKDLYFYLFAGNIVILSVDAVTSILKILMLTVTIIYGVFKAFTEFSQMRYVRDRNRKRKAREEKKSRY